MYFLKNYYQNILQYDLINKFYYKTPQTIPELKKIVLSFSYRNPNIKIIAASLLALELITTKRGTITKTNNTHILLKIRKGNPVGCKVILKRTVMYNFFAKILIDIFPQTKEFKKFHFQQKQNTFSCKLKNSLIFLELEQNYNLFNNISNLNITIITNTNTQNELLFLLNSFKFPLSF
jgi:large subunit ribosomal protein L5